MRVGVDQAGNDAGTGRVQLIAVEPYRPSELSIFPEPDHPPAPGCQRAVDDAAKRIAVCGHHGGELTRVPKHEIRLDHIGRSISCSRAKAIAVS